ncbi:MAG: hypothetical protein JSS79_10060 [Bacteroidetes bacterium]|nr:hypothetical protein [Bacteroidota bacterium]
MKSETSLLRDTARLLAADVSLFRKIILDSGGGQLPLAIKEKERLLHDIEKMLESKPEKK